MVLTRQLQQQQRCSQVGVCGGGGGRMLVIIRKRRVLWKRVKLKKGWTDDKEKEAHTER